MLDMGFEPAMRKLLLGADMPSSERRQTMMFSATFAAEVQHMAADFLYEYVFCAVGRVGGANESVSQTLVRVKNSEKSETLLHYLSMDPETGERLQEKDATPATIIFCGQKKTCVWLAVHLRAHGYSAGDIHGEREQWEREATLKAFKTGEIRCLVASDVAARGLDIPKVARVINYDLPACIDDYVHRIGRTGRAGHRGCALSFFVEEAEKGMDAAGRPQDYVNIGIAPQLAELLVNAKSECPCWLIDAAGVQAEKLAAKKSDAGKQQDVRRRHRR
eukprot:gnl/TRDRNA2_/TRDRNA2_118694_c2_seq1.p1 gnl/TRDRNA2_/TRDRNA2_118694_c2~~gnl/TRDRNA2_/TRDRNA2_118694_c2_seq1.p1  ORF type:complete len:276 (-),score=52.06 gnl/TRDRNA2_/TRDRNA2_118694_c2_seq1:61-888(-)